MEKHVYVYIDLPSLNAPALVGKLFTHVRNQQESATFHYDETWLTSPFKFALEPSLMLGKGALHTPQNHAIFGAIADSAPDRWGRMLMRRQEKYLSENNKPKRLWEIDYLLRVNDETRQGALRFAEKKEGVFLAKKEKNIIPPIIELPTLLHATEQVLSHKETKEDLQLIFAPGSSLGGARPKASVYNKGTLCIAKFPNQHDDFYSPKWEALALTLAKKAKIPTPKWQLHKILSKDVLMLERFDRIGDKRIPFLSAMSMLSANDNETHSYLEIAQAIRQQSANPKKDLHQLWRRIVFNILITNTDDHLRNHAFIYNEATGWQLSPAYDLNPTPQALPATLSLAIDDNDTTASIDLALSVGSFFDLSQKECNTILQEVKAATATWENECQKLDIPILEMKRYTDCFL